MDTQKKILITYFENFGFSNNNKTCTKMKEELKKYLSNYEKNCDFLSLRTQCIPTYLANCSLKNLLKELTYGNYEYIISIGTSAGFKCTLERYDCFCDCYALNIDELSKTSFKTTYGPHSFEMGACYKVRNILFLNHQIAANHPKFEFIHIGQHMWACKMSSAANEIANQIIKIIQSSESETNLNDL